MLLVGSFEPFDEAEARRVGADDTLTKPFQSIRTLVEKVGVLLGREVPPPARPSILQKNEPESLTIPAEAAEVDSAQTLDGASTLDGAQTLEPLAPSEPVIAEPLSSGELDLMTADTRPLSNEIQTHHQAQPAQDRAIENVLDVQKMETHLTSNAAPATSEGFGETILDLDDYESAPLVSADDVVLDIDFEAPAPAQSYTRSHDPSESSVAVAPAVAAVAEGEYAAAASKSEVTAWQDFGPGCHGNTPDFVDLKKLVHDIRVLFDMVDNPPEQSDLLFIPTRGDDDQQAGMEFHALVQTTKVPRVVRYECEVGLESEVDKRPNGRAGAADPGHMRGFNPTRTRYVDKVRSQALVNEKLDHR